MEEQLGVELDAGFQGENDGTLGGKNYFDSGYKRGIFILPEDVLEILKGKRRENVYKLQERVKLRSGFHGTVRYIGNPIGPKFKKKEKGKWYGIELDKDNGADEEGSVNGKVLFHCKRGHAAWVQLHQIRVRLDLEEADMANRTRKSTVNRVMVAVEIEDWPLGFMFKSTAKVPEVVKVTDEAVQRRGLKPGMTLEWLNQKCVGHLTVAQTLDRLTVAEFPLKLKFTQQEPGSPRSPRGGSRNSLRSTRSPASPASPRGRSSSLSKRGVQLPKNIPEPINNQEPAEKRSHHNSPKKIITVEDAGSALSRDVGDDKASLLQNQAQSNFHEVEHDSEGTEVGSDDGDKDKNCIVM